MACYSFGWDGEKGFAHTILTYGGVFSHQSHIIFVIIRGYNAKGMECRLKADGYL